MNEPEANPTTPNRRILIVDDNRLIHEDYRKVLCGDSDSLQRLERVEAVIFKDRLETSKLLRFEVDSAYQGQEGLAKVKQALQAGRPYAVAFVDVRMPPGWDGVETIPHLWQEDPHLQVVLCTAYSDYTWEQIRQKLGLSDRLLILKKPFDNIEVIQLANALTDKWNLSKLAQSRMEDLERMVAERTRELQKAYDNLRLSQERLMQQDRLAAVGQLSGGVAHEFNNIMTVIRGYTSLLLAETHLTTETKDFLKEIGKGADRATNLTRQLLVFSRKQVMQPRLLDLNEVMCNLTRLLQRILGEGVTLKIARAPNLPVIRADQAMIEQLITNLALNARDAMPEGGPLTINTWAIRSDQVPASRHADARPGSYVCLEVIDKGCGMDASIQAHLFEPFFTTKDVGKGTGLGLAAVYGIVKQHQGWIEVESEVNVGSTFRVFLPTVTQKAESQEPAVPEITPAGYATVLAVDDDLAVLALIQKVLTPHGYRILTAASADEVNVIWQQKNTEIDALIIDLDMTGTQQRPVELAAGLRSKRPALQIIYTGSDNPKIHGVSPHPNSHESFLAKPFEPAALISQMGRCLEGRMVGATGFEPATSWSQTKQ